MNQIEAWTADRRQVKKVRLNDWSRKGEPLGGWTEVGRYRGFVGYYKTKEEAERQRLIGLRDGLENSRQYVVRLEAEVTRLQQRIDQARTGQLADERAIASLEKRIRGSE